MYTLKEFYEMIQDEVARDYPETIRCETCGKGQVGDFTSLPDYGVAFCPISEGDNYRCFEDWVTDHIVSEAEYRGDMERERKAYDIDKARRK